LRRLVSLASKMASSSSVPLSSTTTSISKKLPLLLFDVDGTLTEPRLAMSAGLREYLLELRAKGVPLAVVGGSDLRKVTEQLGESLDDVTARFDWLFTENGLVGFKGTSPLPVASIHSCLGERDLQRLINWVLAYFARLELPCKRGNFVEFRNGMLNFSPVGRSCSYEERLQFNAYDKEHGIRVKFAEELRREFTDLDLEVAIGGQISVDVYPRGWDKTYCLRYLEGEYETIHFFGDRTMEGGNDHAIFVDPRTVGHTVTSPEDTRDQISAVLKGLID
ncbi:hypothetical protein PENTCL1PPCAC_24988, partial [Pristionchus entomophagus]